MAAKSFVKAALRNTTLAVVLMSAMPSLMVSASGDAAAPDHQKRSRSNFQYHDGSAPEKRPYRRPNPDVDPTNLSIEELRERINSFEERLERLEFQLRLSNGGQ